MKAIDYPGRTLVEINQTIGMQHGSVALTDSTLSIVAMNMCSA